MKSYQVIVNTSVNNTPKKHELSAALILASHYKTDVVFLRPQANRTPDVDINGVKWEIKSPIGGGKKTIENNFRNARGQSRNVVLDLRRIKMNHNKANARIRAFLSKPHRFKKVLIITKGKKVIEVLWIGMVWWLHKDVQGTELNQARL